MIFIVADHGHSGGYFGLNDLPGVDKDSAVEVPASERIPKRIMESGLPLILVKRFNETGTMKTSDSPVSLSDIPNTVFTELGISGDFAGEAMFRVEPSAIRPRRFTFFKWGQDDSVGDYFPVMKHYTVTGHSWLQGSWRSYKAGKTKVSK
ncbi:MAG: hypothetical protein GY940_18460, partial [bacterium]|nr:hypothetical protein [bacterium]